MIGVGLLLAFCQILGMAVTISTLGVAVLIGKNLTLQTLDRHYKISQIVQQIIDIYSGLLYAGLWFAISCCNSLTLFRTTSNDNVERIKIQRS